jgi:hypothetical protein
MAKFESFNALLSSVQTKAVLVWDGVRIAGPDWLRLYDYATTMQFTTAVHGGGVVVGGMLRVGNSIENPCVRMELAHWVLKKTHGPRWNDFVDAHPWCFDCNQTSSTFLAETHVLHTIQGWDTRFETDQLIMQDFWLRVTQGRAGISYIGSATGNSPQRWQNFQVLTLTDVIFDEVSDWNRRGEPQGSHS